MRRCKPTERDEFIAAIQREYPDRRDVAAWCRRIMRHGATLGRLAEASCNGDWPADNGERKTKQCPKCESGWVPSSFKRGLCPDCACEASIVKLCAEIPGVEPVFGGDPRGYTLRLRVPSKASNTMASDGIGVPTS